MRHLLRNNIFAAFSKAATHQTKLLAGLAGGVSACMVLNHMNT